MSINKMASGWSKDKMSDETFDYICTSCAEENLIKEAIKYCVVCQRYCCHDCVSAHKRIPILKGHILLDTSSGTLGGQQSLLPSFPTEQCSIHQGKILDMYCGNHNVVGCYVCVAIDHKTCEDLSSVTDNIDKLFKKSDTDQTKNDLAGRLDAMKKRRNATQTLLQQLRVSKTSAVQAVKDYRSEIDKYLDDLEDASIKDLEREFRKMESELLEERKRYDNFIDELNNLDDLITQSVRNTAQLFVCTKLAQQKIMSTKNLNKETARKMSAMMSFVPVAEMRQLVKGLPSLGKSAVNTTSWKDDLYEATLIKTIDIKLTNDTKKFSICGSCIVDDTVLFTDYSNQNMKRVDILTFSVVDSCELFDHPYGVCRVGTKEVAVACSTTIQFVSIHDKFSLLRKLKMKHKCYGIAYKHNKLYITDESKSVYMYAMSGKLLKRITNDKLEQPLFFCSNHIAFSDQGDIMFVGDDKGRLVCFNSKCDHVMTIKDTDAGAYGVCVDGRGNVLVANYVLNCIVQFSQDGEKRGVIVSSDNCLSRPRSVCFHQGLKRMFVTKSDNLVQVFQLS